MSRRAACRARCERYAAGFTLVEMLVCLAILALLLAVFVPALSGSRDKARLEASAHELALALRATRDLALARSAPQSFAIDADKHAYLAGGTPHPLDLDIDVELIAPAAAGRGGAIRFFADGGSSGGVLRLSQQDRRLDIVVDWLTGRVSIAAPGG